jgi:hypothetical protein
LSQISPAKTRNIVARFPLCPKQHVDLTMNLKTSDKVLDDLNDLIEKTRPKTKTLAVNKKDLFNLVTDHRQMFGKLQEWGEL